jgi:hypothetical protein
MDQNSQPLDDLDFKVLSKSNRRIRKARQNEREKLNRILKVRPVELGNESRRGLSLAKRDDNAKIETL